LARDQGYNATMGRRGLQRIDPHWQMLIDHPDLDEPE
jgi:hypothetical protein